MNILITNAVPLNVGDEALLRAVVQTFAERWPGSYVKTLCSQMQRFRKYATDLNLASDLEYASTPDELRHSIELYRDADLVLAAPGGMLNDHYEFGPRLDGLEYALDLGIPVLILPQSIGPFWKSESRERIGCVLGRVARIFVRDRASVQHLMGCCVPAVKIVETADAAFLWRRLARESFRAKHEAPQTIGLCFRAWPLGDVSAAKETIAKAVTLCEHLLTCHNRRLQFISTCQGDDAYVDDSRLAREIVLGLSPDLQSRCQVVADRLCPVELISRLAHCDAVISMRLHVCILAMLGGTPALGLGYEDKTAQIFAQLGLDRYQVDFRAGIDDWLARVSSFFQNHAQIAASLPEMLDLMYDRAQRPFEEIGRLLSHDSQTVGGEVTCTEPDGAERVARIDRFLTTSYERLRWRQRSRLAAGDIAGAIPQCESLILIDDLQLGEDVAGDRVVVTFPERDGQYWGPPPDGAVSVEELVRRQAQGIRYVAIGWPSFWWLREYPELAEYLAGFAEVLHNDRLIIYDMQSHGAGVPATTASVAAFEKIDEYSIIDRIQDENLTYLSAGALFELYNAVRRVEDADLEGCLIEAGVARGGSLLLMTAAKRAARPLVAYDTFGMIPAPALSEEPCVHARYEEIHSGAAQGIGGDRYYGYEVDLYQQVAERFARFDLPLESNSVCLVRGEFQTSLFPAGPVALAHIDCDWHDSVKVCLERIEPLLVPGGILIIDDYFRWPGCQRAVDEYFHERRDRFRFYPGSRLQIVKRK